jgi:ankyrin repeat protein
VDSSDETGDTLLMVAAAQGHADTVAVLLARGADHSRVNDRGQTALGVAVFRQSAETVRHLLTAGADPDAGGPSARATAFYFGLPHMTALLEGAAR